MAETPKTNDRIEELRSRLAGDPKSRLFYPLAEELRKIGAFEEAEGVLRSGLEVHGSYLSAWISLGRVLKELGRHDECIEVLDRALALDQGNVVAARLLAESHLAAGNRVEAIKKYKLVRALHPADDELEDLIAQLERDIETDSQAETDRVVLQAESPPEATDEIAPQAGGSESAGPGATAPVSSTEPIRETPAPPSPEVPEAIGEDTSPVFESHAAEGIVPEGAPEESAGVPEEEPFGPSEVSVGVSPMESDVAAESLDERPQAAPFEEDSPFAVDESTPMDAVAAVSSSSRAEQEADAPPIPPTSADLFGRGRNKARIERLERWLEKIRSE